MKILGIEIGGSNSPAPAFENKLPAPPAQPAKVETALAPPAQPGAVITANNTTVETPSTNQPDALSDEVLKAQKIRADHRAYIESLHEKNRLAKEEREASAKAARLKAEQQKQAALTSWEAKFKNFRIDDVRLSRELIERLISVGNLQSLFQTSAEALKPHAEAWARAFELMKTTSSDIVRAKTREAFTQNMAALTSGESEVQPVPNVLEFEKEAVVTRLCCREVQREAATKARPTIIALGAALQIAARDYACDLREKEMAACKIGITPFSPSPILLNIIAAGFFIEKKIVQHFISPLANPKDSLFGLLDTTKAK